MDGKISQRFHCASAEDTLAVGERLGRRLLERYPEGVLVLLIGTLGAGKTVMARGIARGIGVSAPVISPTYTIISDYAAPTRELHHVDLYRIEGGHQIENLGLDDILRGDGIVLIEWGEKLEQQLGGAAGLGGYLRVTISIAGEGRREVSIEEIGAIEGLGKIADPGVNPR